MTTQYQHTITLAVPSALIEDANNLASLMGENPVADFGTFKSTAYTDGTTEYAVAHTVVRPTFLEPLGTGELPPDSDNAPEEYDRTRAESAFATLNEPNGMLMAVDKDPHEQFELWGLSRIPTDDEI